MGQRDIFVSHASEDRNIVTQLITELRKASKKGLNYELTYYLDEKDFQPGDNLDERISNSIIDSKYVVMIISSKFMGKKYTTLEREFSIKRQKKIIPIWLDVDKEDIEKYSTELADLLSIPLSADSVKNTAWRILKKIFPNFQMPGATRILISTESEFTKELRTKLCEHNKIEMADLYEGQGKDFDITYMNGLEEFLNDKEARLLYSVLFEEGDYIFTDEKAEELIRDLERAKKKIIFFESGMNFIRFVEGKNEKPIVVIKTDYEAAVKRLIDFVVKQYLKKSANIHFITILGPINNPAAIERRKIFNTFLSCLLLNRDIMADQNNNQYFNSAIFKRLFHYLNDAIETLQITTLRIDSWLRTEAQTIIENFYCAFPLPDKTFHHCFLCGNDDIALGVNDAIRLKTKRAVKDLNVSFIGFDGISEMVRSIKNNDLKGATIKVPFDDMCKMALEIKEEAAYTGKAERYVYGEIIPYSGNK